MTAQPQSHWCLVRRNDGLYTVLDIGLENMILGKLALDIGREPYTRQSACLPQQGV